MKLRRRGLARVLVAAGAVAGLFNTSQSLGQALITWNNAAGGTFGTAGNWNPAAVPGTLDTAVFPAFGVSYILHFNANHSIANYTFNGGTASVNAVTTTRTLSVSNNFTVAGGSSGWGFGTLPMNVNIGNDILINNGRLFVDESYDFTCDQLSLATVTASVGSLNFQGAGTTFISNSTGVSNIGLNGGSGTMEFDLGAAGTFNGSLNLAISGVANTKAFVAMLGGSDLTVFGSLNAGTGTQAGQATTINVLDAGSSIDIGGAGNFNLGAANTSAATLTIGAGASFSSGTGATLVNATGRIVNSGLFVMNGNGTFTGQGAIGVAAAYDGGAGTYVQAANTSVVFQTDAAGTFNALTLSNPGSQMTFNGVLSALTANSTTNLGAVGGVSSLTINGSQATLVGDLNIADSSGEQGVVTITGGAGVTLGDDLDIGISTGASTQGTLNITGIGATAVFQNASNTITVGASSGGQGTINLTGGRLTTALNGSVTVNPTGRFNVNGGTLNLQGSLTVNGGVFDKTTASVLNLTASQSINATGGGIVSIDGGLDTPASYAITATGASTIDFGSGSLQLNEGSTLAVDGGSDVIATALRVATSGGSGVATFSGSGTTLRTTSAANLLQIGQGGFAGTVTFQSLAIGTLAGGIGLADSGVASSAGTLNILSNADLFAAGPIRIGAGGAAGQIGRLNISSAGSTLTQTGANSVVVGAASNSVGSVTIGASGTFTTGTGSFLIGNTGQVDVLGALNTGGDLVMATAGAGIELGSASSSGRLNVAGVYDGTAGAPSILVDINQGTFTAGSILRSDTIRYNATAGDQVTIVVNGGTISNNSAIYVLDNAFAVDNATARLRLTNGATMTLSDTFFVGNLNSNAELRVESGSTLTADALVGTFFEGGFDPDRTANTVVDGTNSVLALGSLGYSPNQFAFGLGTLTVQNGGSLSVLNELYMFNETDFLNIKVGGTVHLASGAELYGDMSTLNLTGGTLSLANVTQLSEFLVGGLFGSPNFNFNSGTLRFRSSTDITADLIDRTLVNRTLGFGQAIQVDGTGTFSGALVLDGGTLTVQSLANASQVQLKTGRLNITAGALTVGAAGQFGASLTLGEGMTVGTVGGTTVQAGGLLRLNGGKLDSGGSINLQTGGELELLGSTSELVGGTLSNSGLVSGSGRIGNRLANNIGGIVRSSTGQFLRFTAGTLNTNSGTLQMLGGNIEFSGSLTINSTGNITGEGNLLVNGGISNNGTMTFSGGPTSILATVTNNSTGRTTVTGGAHATFFNPVTNAAGSQFRVAENSIAAFLAPVTGLGAFTGPGTKIFESTASGGPLATGGRSRVEFAGQLVANVIREDRLEIVGDTQVAPAASPISPSVNRLNTLAIEGSPDNWIGSLDLSNNALLLDYTGASPMVTIANQLRQGFNNGAWNGNGISSSVAAAQVGRAIGFAEAAAIGSPATFLGEPIDASTIILRFTIAGDADLSGGVNLDDFTRLAAAFGTSSTWSAGDFTYDGVTNLDDFTALAANFGLTLTADISRSAVPEPAGLGLVSIAALMTARRRRPDGSLIG